MTDQWFHKIFSVTETAFEQLALEIFGFQYRNNLVYKDYVNLVRKNPEKITTVNEIPFLPVRFFKTHEIKTTAFRTELIFESSGTTETLNSKHYIKDVSLYKQSLMQAFERSYGPVHEWCILGLLPSYLERKNSSLVFMVQELIRNTQHPQSDFYLYDHKRLRNTLTELENNKQKTLLIGVSFALLDFAESCSLELEHTTIMETGGMKGRKEEIIRSELHERLKERFHVDAIHSEYGMTELLSQAYSPANGIFHCPPWMKIFIRDEEDPFALQQGTPERDFMTTDPRGRLTTRGAINIIDLANIYSCSFIATDDAGKLHPGPDGFEVLGRLDNSDIRGCSLMAI